jgi:hypothetical protein
MDFYPVRVLDATVLPLLSQFTAAAAEIPQYILCDHIWELVGSRHLRLGTNKIRVQTEDGCEG